MKCIITLACTAFLFVTLFNGTLVKKASITGNSLPDVDFSGTIVDVDGKQYNVQNVTVSGIYKNIIVYPKPNDPKNFSTRNFEKLDLAEIKEIKPNHANKFKHRGMEYIEIQVTRKDGGVDNYMVMGRKSVQATREPKSGSIAKILDMNQLKSLTMTGYTRKKEDNNNNNTTPTRKASASAKTTANKPAHKQLNTDLSNTASEAA